MDAFETTAEAACSPNATPKGAILPGLVAAARTRSGNTYLKAIGRAYVDGSETQSLHSDGVFYIASLSKLITTVAVLQCVERGLLDLDQDITTVLPEWANVQVLTGFDDNGKPTTQPTTTPITLRMLLTHTSGMAHDFFHPHLMKYRSALGLPLGFQPTIHETFARVLLHPPGQIFEYSPGLDWAGLMIERVTGLKLGEYMQRNIFDPLGIPRGRIGFNVEGLAGEVVPRTERAEDGTLGALREADGRPRRHVVNTDHQGGGGLFARAEDYLTILAGVFLTDNPTILKRETIDMMHNHQIADRALLHLSLIHI